MSLRTVRVLAASACLLPLALAAAPTPATAEARPAVRHVWTIMLENEDFAASTAIDLISGSGYLTQTLAARGARVSGYFGTGHSSLDNYLAMVSGQGPTDNSQDDCNDDAVVGGSYTHSTFDKDGQALGTPAAIAKGDAGCVYAADVPTLMDQLQARRLTWRGYMEDVDADPAHLRSTCQAARWSSQLNAPKGAKAKAHNDYKRKHDPAVYFHSVTGLAPASGKAFDTPGHAPSPVCDASEVPLTRLTADLKQAPEQVPTWNLITPNQCNDGHDNPCSDGRVGGVTQIDSFLPPVVDAITSSAAFKKDGLLIVTFDEGSEGLACCNEQRSPNLKPGNDNGGLGGFSTGPVPLSRGGGQVGAIMLAPFIAPGTISTECYNHYSYLRSMEDLLGLGATKAIPGSDGKGHLGYAGRAGLTAGGVAVPCQQMVSFGSDIFTQAVSAPQPVAGGAPGGSAPRPPTTTRPAQQTLALTGLPWEIPLAGAVALVGLALARRRA